MKHSELPENFSFSQTLPLWKLDTKTQTISREFVFADFQQAFEFMKRCAVYAEEIDHHPDWSNSWNKVFVSLTTHSAKQLTDLDIRLAKRMDVLAEQISLA